MRVLGFVPQPQPTASFVRSQLSNSWDSRLGCPLAGEMPALTIWMLLNSYSLGSDRVPSENPKSWFGTGGFSQAFVERIYALPKKLPELADFSWACTQ